MNTRPEFTFKHNLKQGRHGWLRLTPAHSIKVIHQILDEHPEIKYVLDPFSGTGTTGLVCGERGLKSDLIDINPFLVWFNRTKISNYSVDQIVEAKEMLYKVVSKVRENTQYNLWFPPISNIDRWWPKDKLNLLARIYREINDSCFEDNTTKNLLLVAFCRVLIEWSNAAFNHQSMSFKEINQTLVAYHEEFLIAEFINTAATIVDTVTNKINGQINIFHADSRHVPKPEYELYDCVITSPPYPNRMSYIRELRPYMYWLEYLKEVREAGELDWQAIGGTWGIATSLLKKWQPNGITIDYPDFYEIISAIASRSILLANYVHKYFIDIALHLESLFPYISNGGKVFYVVGNCKFYEILVPVQDIYLNLLNQAGFTNTHVSILRKRNSKKELYEFIIYAQKK